MSSAASRDYYEQLFSSDSDATSPFNNSHVEDAYDIPEFCQKNVDSESCSPDTERIEVSNIEILLDKLYDQLELPNSSYSITSQDSDEETLACFDSTNFSQTSRLVTSDDNSDTSSNASELSLDFIPENEMIRLLRDDSESVIEQRSKNYQSVSHDNAPHHTFSCIPEYHEDIIGTYNIQNQYDHNLAAKLFLNGKFTFLSLQEPFATRTSIQDSWGAFRRLELNSARISCFETQHQIIMFDNWRWGGKIIDTFSTQLDGRIASLAFGFDGDQCLGIISIYGYARGSIDAIEENNKNDLRRSLLYSVKKTCRKWKKKFPNIHIMLIGDMQETVSVSNLDNLGQCRYKNDEDHSIIENFKISHTSIVRDRLGPDDQYLTRFGSEGARGIDHILFPEGNAQRLIKEASIDNFLGSTYFPSDHRLLQCTFIRNGPNNAEMSESTAQYDFKNIFQIQLKRSGDKGDILTLDDDQFKQSKKFEKNADLYQKVQDLTSNSAASTDMHLSPIERSIKSLYASLWEAGLTQDSHDGKKSLVKISERQAAELAAIVNSFDAGIKDTMDFLHLSKERNCISDMAATRINVKNKSSFKLFQNLPLPTKLRYYRGWVKEKRRQLKRHLLAIKEFELRQTLNATHLCSKSITRSWDMSIADAKLTSSAKSIFELWSKESEERENHVLAVQYSKGSSDGKLKDLRNSLQSMHGDSHHISSKTLNLINFWLSESNCSQHFGSKNPKNAFDFLSKDTNNWNEPLKKLNIFETDWNNDVERQNIKQTLEASLNSLKKMEYQVSSAQRVYKHATIEYFLKVNKIEEFTRKVKPKAREAPATHTELWDSKLEAFRPCRNENEELLATGQHHGQWMGNSAAAENCAFASLKQDGLLGIRGINLHPNRKVTFKDIPQLIKNGNNLSSRDKKAFIAAHGPHTASLFQPPQKDHDSLRYPFFLKSSKGDMESEEEVARLYWKAISSVPGKARYEGFQMAVVGRFGRRWQWCMHQIVKLILIMRFVPKRLKSIARFPIPKPGRINEYRPISLCHDLYCFINSVSTKFSSEGILKAKILHEGIAAYVKGKGCSLLVGVEQGVREDCLESGIPTSQTDEDEEKYFDRIPVEILLAAMRVNGFPTEGYIELKASGMGPKTVEIITVKGVAHARFVCGLEQGNPDSPTIANLVINFKHDIWTDILQEVHTSDSNQAGKLNQKKNKTNKDAYKFHITDPEDGPVWVDKIGYCDDNTRFTSSMNELEVLEATKLYIQRAGDLSLVTKIGRKGSKSEVHYYNLSAAIAIKIQKIDSFAWSFSNDGPAWEKVPFKIQLQPKELEKAYKLVEFEKMEEEDKAKFLKNFRPVAHKHLGLKSTLSGCTKSASNEVLNKIKARILSLGLPNMQDASQKLCANMLCSTMHSYAPLQMSHNKTDLLECDALLVKCLRKRKGLSSTDASHSLFLDESNGGYGIQSFLLFSEVVLHKYL